MATTRSTLGLGLLPVTGALSADPAARPADAADQAVGAGGPVAPSISVIVPCRQHATPLADCLGALAGQVGAPPFEVIVVDAAHDDAVAAVAKRFAWVRPVRSRAGLLAGEARNLGVAHARGELLAFTDADCVPRPGWLAAAAGALRHGARLVGGPVTDLRPYHPIARADNLLQFAHVPAERPAMPAKLLPGGNSALRRADFLAAGGFRHPARQIAGEDVILCEAVSARWPGATRFVPAMAVRHAGRSTLAAYLRHQYVFGYARGALGLCLKPVHGRLGRWLIMLGPVVLKRLTYIAGQSLRWRGLAGLLPVIVLLPVLLAGLVGWAVGFRHGLLSAAVEPARPAAPGPTHEPARPAAPGRTHAPGRESA